MNMMNAKIVGCGKQTLLLSHGYGTSQAVWDNVVPELSKRYTVVLFDWCFSGAINDDPMNSSVYDASKYTSYSSFSDDLISLVHEMNLKDVVFVGHSMAGMIGCIASIKRPDLFSRLLLVATSPRYLNTKDYVGGFEKVEVDNMLSNIESNFPTWAEGFVTLVVGENDASAKLKLEREFKKMRSETALSVARIVFLSDVRDILGSVSIPCTIIQGTNDIVVPVSVGEYMRSKIIKGTQTTVLELIKIDGHFPQLTAPLHFINVLDKVLIGN